MVLNGKIQFVGILFLFWCTCSTIEGLNGCLEMTDAESSTSGRLFEVK